MGEHALGCLAPGLAFERALATWSSGTRRAAAISTMSATPASPSSSALIQTSCTLRRSAISNSRTA
jgi:hypothetical protein